MIGPAERIVPLWSGKSEHTTATSAVVRREVSFAAILTEAIHGRAQELHERALARFVLAVKHNCTFGEPLNREVAPNAEAVDFNVGNPHRIILLVRKAGAECMVQRKFVLS